MFKFIACFLLGLLAAAPAAQAAIAHNQWQSVPPAKKAAAAEEKAAAAGKSGAAEKQRKPRAERVRLVNIKDKNHKLTIACRANSGHVQINALFGGDDKMPAGTSQIAAEKTGADKKRAKAEKTTLSLMIDGQPVLKDSEALLRRAKQGNRAVHANLNGDDTVRFISRFLAAKKLIAVSAGSGAAETYTAANAAQAGLALQNCLHK